MFEFLNGKVNSSAVTPVEVSKPKQHCCENQEHSVKKIEFISHPILKTIGLVLLFGALTVLSSYSLVGPVIATEMTRLIFLCALALMIQKESNSRSYYTDRIVTTFLYG